MTTEPSIAKLLEKQMRNWEIARQQRVEEQKPQAELMVEEFITISRAVGAGGKQIAEKLSEKLGWPLFDREILQMMAENDDARTRLYEKMDERDTSWLESVLRWMLQGELRKEDYYYRLYETVLALARQSPAIFLGRGADLILPQGRGIRLAFFASRPSRVRNYAQSHAVDEKFAAVEVERIGRQRDEFVRRNFNVEPNDMSRFDLQFNLDRVSTDNALALILDLMKRRGLAK